MIKGFYSGEFPVVSAYISFRDVATRASPVPFFVDSGARVSVLQAHDIDRLGIDLALFVDRPLETSIGIGGQVVFRRAMAYIEFDDADSPVRQRFRIALRLAEQSEPALPSILGLDFLNGFRVTLCWRDRLVLLEPQM